MNILYKILIACTASALSLIVQAQIAGISSGADSYSSGQYSANITVGMPVADFYVSEHGSAYIGFPAFAPEIDIVSDITLEGLVHTGDSLLDLGILKILDSETFALLDSFVISEGSFRMFNIPVGTYILMAEPLNLDSIYYYTTYYVNKTVIEQANILEVNTAIINLDLQMVLKEEFKTGSEELVDFEVFPNPVHDHLTVDFYSNSSATLTFDVYDLLGQKIRHSSFGAVPGGNRHEFNLGDLKPGLYMVNISCKSSKLFNEILLVE